MFSLPAIRQIACKVRSLERVTLHVEVGAYLTHFSTSSLPLLFRRLQETFNILQSNTKGRLRNLPNLPENMPSSFYEMLEGALSYRHKERSEAGQLMKGEFSQFHIHHAEAGGGKPGTISIHEVAAEAAGEHAITTPETDNFSGAKKTISVVLEGSVS